MKILDYKPSTDYETTIAQLTKELADTKAELQRLTTNTNTGIAPIANLSQAVNNLNARVSQLQAAQGSVVPTIADLSAIANPPNLTRVSVTETGLRYEFKQGSYVGQINGRVEKPDGVWTPVNWVADPSFLRSQDFGTRYERTLKGATINRLQFDICQRDDRSKTVAIDITDFVTGCTVSSYWNIMGRFFDQLVIDRTLRLFVGVDTATGRVIIMVMDNGLANPKYCWIRNVRINGLAADLADGFEIARSAFPKN